MNARFYMIWILVLFMLVACGGADEENQNDETLTADAGEDFTVMVGEVPTFDGCGSEGSIVNYRWMILEAPEVRVQDNGKVIRELEPDCSFTLGDAMVIEEVGNWVIQLEVRDDEGNTATDTVTVMIEAE